MIESEKFEKMTTWSWNSFTKLSSLLYVYLSIVGVVFTLCLSEEFGFKIIFYYSIEDYLLSALHRSALLLQSLFWIIVSALVYCWWPFPYQRVFPPIFLIFPILTAIVWAQSTAAEILDSAENQNANCVEWTIYVENEEKAEKNGEFYELAGIDILKNYYVGIEYGKLDKKSPVVIVIPKSSAEIIKNRKCERK